MLVGYLDSIPRELEQATYVDGCGPIGALFKVVIPTAMPGIVAVASWRGPSSSRSRAGRLPHRPALPHPRPDRGGGEVLSVKVARPSQILTDPSGPMSWLGANFWSRIGGPRMWRTFDEAVVHKELAVLAEHGLDVTRSFFNWPDFHPEPFRIDEELVARFGRFLDLHLETGMRTIPTFIVGHMSGGNWDPLA